MANNNKDGKTLNRTQLILVEQRLILMLTQINNVRKEFNLQHQTLIQHALIANFPLTQP